METPDHSKQSEKTAGSLRAFFITRERKGVIASIANLIQAEGFAVVDELALSCVATTKSEGRREFGCFMIYVDPPTNNGHDKLFENILKFHPDIVPDSVELSDEKFQLEKNPQAEDFFETRSESMEHFEQYVKRQAKRLEQS